MIMLKDLIKKILKVFGIGASNTVDYISLGESLPTPLTPEEEQEVVLKMLSGDENARLTLIERNLRLVVYIAKKFDNTRVELDDLVSIGTIGLIKSISGFDPTKNIKLATFASRCIENEILMHLRKVSKIRREVSLDEPLNTDAEGNELCISDILCSEKDDVTQNIDKEDEFSNLKIALEELGDKEKEIMLMRYGLRGKTEMTQKQVADYFEISQSYISRLEKRIMKRLKKEIVRYE